MYNMLVWQRVVDENGMKNKQYSRKRNGRRLFSGTTGIAVSCDVPNRFPIKSEIPFLFILVSFSKRVFRAETFNFTTFFRSRRKHAVVLFSRQKLTSTSKPLFLQLSSHLFCTWRASKRSLGFRLMRRRMAVSHARRLRRKRLRRHLHCSLFEFHKEHVQLFFSTIMFWLQWNTFRNVVNGEGKTYVSFRRSFLYSIYFLFISNLCSFIRAA